MLNGANRAQRVKSGRLARWHRGGAECTSGDGVREIEIRVRVQEFGFWVGVFIPNADRYVAVGSARMASIGPSWVMS
jgi:hypothetical protein